MMKWITVENLKKFWWELDRKYDLILKFNIFPGHIFLSNNSDKTQEMKKITKHINLKAPTYWCMWYNEVV